MKLFTYCETKEATYLCDDKQNGVKLKEYSYEEYLRFMDSCKKYFVSHYHTWYETDMSDKDEGTTSERFSINYSNMIIKDNEVYGVLVKTTNMFPRYYILVLEKKHKGVELGGGYEEDSHDWLLKEHCIDETSYEYILINEQINISINKTNYLEKISGYTRKIVGFLGENLIYNNGKLVGFKYGTHNFIIDDEATWISKINKENQNSSSIEKFISINTLIKVNRAFLDEKVFDSSYLDFYNKQHKIFSNIKKVNKYEI